MLEGSANLKVKKRCQRNGSLPKPLARNAKNLRLASIERSECDGEETQQPHARNDVTSPGTALGCWVSFAALCLARPTLLRRSPPSRGGRTRTVAAPSTATYVSLPWRSKTSGATPSACFPGSRVERPRDNAAIRDRVDRDVRDTEGTRSRLFAHFAISACARPGKQTGRSADRKRKWGTRRPGEACSKNSRMPWMPCKIPPKRPQ